MHHAGGKIYWSLPEGISGHAEFADNCKHRYVLTRRWKGGSTGTVAFIGLNPSTADKDGDDPTVRTCWLRAKAWGYSAFVMLNAYSFVATKPKDLRGVDPCGPNNDEAILEHSSASDRVIAAWGAARTESDHDRFRRICDLLASNSIDLYCLLKNKDGSPRHPRGVRRDVEPIPYCSDRKTADAA